MDLEKTKILFSFEYAWNVFLEAVQINYCTVFQNRLHE